MHKLCPFLQAVAHIFRYSFPSHLKNGLYALHGIYFEDYLKQQLIQNMAPQYANGMLLFHKLYWLQVGIQVQIQNASYAL